MKAVKFLSSLLLISITTMGYAQLPSALAEKHPELAKDVKKLTLEAKGKNKIHVTAKKQAQKFPLTVSKIHS
ncbi:hypothetical protein FERRO_12410 [Ferrovum sp. JA12]|uniref:hypothetical protein n=1 Tax=Ferrovum sp. JA12 TaxID=1356299 RepID=UPI000702994B|nr:hypothetical protein [Ferrovum sp. JA12]KRH78260.1 hypothetical protein FERRO_12410 [Ferrovum sp. JA12]